MNKAMKDVILENRKKLKMTQEELADCLNVSNKTISNWETGRSYPDVLMIPKLANVLQINVNDLFNVKDVEIEEIEKYDNDKINSFKNKMTIACALLFVPLIILIGFFTEDEIIFSIVLILAITSIIISIIFNIIASNNMIMLINEKYHFQKYANVYYKYKLIYYFICILMSSMILLVFVNKWFRLIVFILDIFLYILVYRARKSSKYKLNINKVSITFFVIGTFLYLITLLTTFNIFRFFYNRYFALIQVLIHLIANILFFINLKKTKEISI